MLIFDTNVVSELMKPKPEPRVSRWVSLQDKEKCYITTVTEAELRFWCREFTKRRASRKTENYNVKLAGIFSSKADIGL